MQNRPQPSQGNVSEPEARPETSISTSSILEEQKQQDYLMGLGFTWEETCRLQHQRVHLYENSEMKQRIAGDSHIHFARWLYEQGEINERDGHNEGGR